MGVHTWFYYPCPKQPTDTELIESALVAENKHIRHVVDILECGTSAKSKKDAYFPFKSRKDAEQYVSDGLKKVNTLLHLRDDESDDNISNHTWIFRDYAYVHNVEWNYFKKFDDRMFSFPYNWTDLFRYWMCDDVVYLCTYEEAYNFVMTHDVKVAEGLTFREMLNELKKFFELHPNGEIMIG